MKENLEIILSTDVEDAKNLSKVLNVLQRYNTSIFTGEPCLFKKDELKGVTFPVFDKTLTLYFSPVDDDTVELKCIDQNDYNAVIAKRLISNILYRYRNDGSIFMVVSSPTYNRDVDKSIVYDIVKFNLGLLFKYDMDELAAIGRIEDVKYITYSIYYERNILRFAISSVDDGITDIIKSYKTIAELSEPKPKDIINIVANNEDACYVQLVELFNEMPDVEKMDIVKQILSKNCHAEIYATGNSKLSVEIFPNLTNDTIPISEYNVAPHVMSMFLDKFEKGELKDTNKLIFSVKENLMDPDVNEYNLEFILNQELQLICLLDEKVAGIFLADKKTASQWISEGEAGIRLVETTNGEKTRYRYFMMEFFNNKIAMSFKKND